MLSESQSKKKRFIKDGCIHISNQLFKMTGYLLICKLKEACEFFTWRIHYGDAPLKSQSVFQLSETKDFHLV